MSTRLLFILLLCFTALRGGAQQRVVQYKPFIDERPWHYGFQIGLHDQGLKLLNNGYINEADGAQWVGENDRQNFGFSVGVLGEWRFTRNLAFRVTPTLHFGSKQHGDKTRVDAGHENDVYRRSCPRQSRRSAL